VSTYMSGLAESTEGIGWRRSPPAATTPVDLDRQG
jgi:hypothetical protein